MWKQTMTALALAGIFAACGDGLGPGDQATVSLSFTAVTGAGVSPSRQAFFSRMAAGDTLVTGSDTLVIDRVQIVMREIELERVNHDACDDDSLGVDDDSLGFDDDFCEEFETGPLLIDLPLGGTVEQVLNVAVDTGTYDEIEFDLHKPDDDTAADLAFLAAHPDFKGVSIRVTGSFNGTPFVYETDLSEEQEIELDTPLVISASSATNLTFRVDLTTWFRGAGGGLINPQTANKGGQNEGIVKENIKNSIEAFEDRDRDGDDSDER